MNKTKKVPIRYYRTKKCVKIKAPSDAFYPMYLKYLFEYLKIPLNINIEFTDKTIVGGITAWLKNNQN